MKRFTLVAFFTAVAMFVYWTLDDEPASEPSSFSEGAQAIDSDRQILTGEDDAFQPTGSSRATPALGTDVDTDQDASANVNTAARSVERWSVSPGDLEAMLGNRLRSGAFGSISVDHVTCSDTQCDILLTKSTLSRLSPAFLGLTRFVRSEPINACGVGTRTDESPNGTFQQRITVSTCRPDPPEEMRSITLGLTANEMRQLGERYLAADDYDAPAVVISDNDGLKLVVENICSVNCPLDLQQVIHWESSEDLPCEDVDRGLPQSFTVRTSRGGFEDRTLCIVVPYE